MSSLWHDIASASFPVAVVLLAGAVAARGVLWTALDDVRSQRLARQYGVPLSTWCLVAVAVHAFAQVAGGDTGLGGLAVSFLVGAAATAVRSPNEVPAAETVGSAPERAVADVVAPPVPTAGSLWAQRAAGDHLRTDGLWGH